MAIHRTRFAGLAFSLIRDNLEKKVLQDGDIKMDKGYCGVAHLQNIDWDGVNVRSAKIQLYVTAFSATNPRGKQIGATDHRVMMEDLGFWDAFQLLKKRACNEEGMYRPDFDVSGETHLFYGFTSKDNMWCNTSCTLNSWIKPASGRENAAAEALFFLKQ